MLMSALSIASVTVIDKKNASNTAGSTQAFAVADSGSELILGYHYRNDQTILDDIPDSTCDGGIVTLNNVSRGEAKITFYSDAEGTTAITDCTEILATVQKIKSVGIYSGSSRAVEVAVGCIEKWKQVGDENRWNAVASADNGRIIYAAAIIDSDYPSLSGIYKSTDYGDTWLKTIAPQRVWSSIDSSADGMRVVAGAQDPSYVYTSDDGGDTWTARTTMGSMLWIAVASSADGNNLVAAAHGDYIYTSVDGGDIWTRQINSGSRRWYSLASDQIGDNLVAAVQDNGYIYTSDDGGVDWTERIDAGLRSWEADGLSMSDDGMKIFAATHISGGGYIYYSDDSGDNWTEMISAGSRFWDGLASSSDGEIIIAVEKGGYIYTSSDGGTIWKENTLFGLRDWDSVASSTDGKRAVALVRRDADPTKNHIYTGQLCE